MLTQRPRDYYIDVRTVTTRYWTLGEGPACAILLHGLGRFVEDWQDNVAALADGRRVYALDLVGFGRTAKPKVKYSITYLVDFVHDFMAVEGMERASLIGSSLGGVVALRLALQYPDQVDKLVLVDSVGFGPELAFYLRFPTLPLIGELLTLPSRPTSTLSLRQMFKDRSSIDADLINQAYEISALRGAQASLLATLRSAANLWGWKRETYTPIRDRAREIRAPTLVIWGAQDRFLPLVQAHRAVKLLPNSKLHVFDPCGHVPNIERAAEFNRVVSAFLSDSHVLR